MDVIVNGELGEKEKAKEREGETAVPVRDQREDQRENSTQKAQETEMLLERGWNQLPI